jgi:hypothetical protein
VLSFTDVMDLLPHEFSRLRCRRFPLPLCFACLLDCFLLRHEDTSPC